MSRTYGKAQDLIDFTRASSGTALRRVKYGAELVTNGGFDTDSDWSKQTGWSIGSGVASFSGGGGVSILQNAGLETGKVYAITFEITSISSGGFILRCGFDNASQTFSTTGTHTANLVCGSNAFIYVQSSGSTTGTIDNVSVKEVTFDTSDGDLILFNHPNNIPRIEYDASGNLLGLLVEESRTNLLGDSEDFDQWTKQNSTVTGNSTIDPAGNNNASLITTSSTSDYIQDTASVTSGSNYTFSVFAKSGTSDGIALAITGTPFSPVVVYFDLSAKTATVTTGSPVYYDIVESSNGWMRLSIAQTATSTASGAFRILSLSESDLSTYYLYGAQVEAGSFPASYIPTSGSTATRSADVASLSTSAFGYRQDEGALYVEADTFGVGSGTSKYMVQMDDATNNNRHTLYISSTDERRWFTGASGSTQQVTGSGIATNNVQFKAIGVYKENDFAFVVDGGSVVTDTVGTTPNGISIARIGVNLVSGEALNGHIKSIKYIPRRLTNDQLVELTS